MTDPAGLRLASARGRLVLATCILGSGVASLDATVVNVALPRIGTDLHVGLSSLQWLLNAYTVTLAGLLLLGGALGDRLGRRRVFVIGLLWFLAASLLCAAAPDAPVLIAARALQGIGGALLTPGSLAILEASFRQQDRGAAIGAWSGLGGVATAAGPVVGGALVGIAPWGWRLVFLLNVPVVAVAVTLALRYVPETRDEQAAGRLDLPGAALGPAGLAGLVFGLTEGPGRGWPPDALAGLVLGIAALAGFVLVEHRAHNPMVPMSLFSSRVFAAGNAVTLLLYAALGGAFFLIPLALQRGAQLSPVVAGSSLLPLTLVMLLLSARMGRLAQRTGPRLPLTVGPMTAAVGLLLLTRIGTRASYLGDILPAVLVLALGLSITVAPLTVAVLGAVPDRLAGVASAVNNDVARTAQLLAVAVIPAAAGISSAAYDHPAALIHGFHRGAVEVAGLAAAAGLTALLMLRPAHPAPDRRARMHCGIEGPALEPRSGPGSAADAAGTSGTARRWHAEDPSRGAR